MRMRTLVFLTLFLSVQGVIKIPPLFHPDLSKSVAEVSLYHILLYIVLKMPKYLFYLHTYIDVNVK